MTGKIKIVTDSTSDIPPARAEELGVAVVPLNVRFGDTCFKDRVDLDSEAFFRMLKENHEPPATSLPSPGDFLEVYSRYASGYDTIISIHISSKLSGTFQSAGNAASALENADLVTIDSGQVASALRLIVTRAARAAAGGTGREELLGMIRDDCGKADIFFVVDTLDYLERGGRIGKAGHMLGSMLNIKPILTVKDGAIETAAKVRTKKKAFGKVMELIAGRPGPPRIAAVGHACCPLEAEQVAGMITGVYPELEVIISEIGPAIGAHSGPGCIEISVI